MYANIIIDISYEKLDRPFQYIIPDDMLADVVPGVLVLIPFGKANRLISGYVIEITDKAEYDVTKLKYIDSIVADSTKIESRLIKIAAWMRDNYGGTMNQAIKTVIPVKTEIKHKEERYIKLAIPKETCNELLVTYAKKNMTARLRFLKELMEKELISSKDTKESSSLIRYFESQGIVTIEKERIMRNPIKSSEITLEKTKLNPNQQYIADTIKMDYANGKRETYLIHGVTGSGKTEVYLELIEYVISCGKEVIMLIPEISLTYQTVMRFYKRFGDSVSIINSRLSKGEKYDQFLRASNSEVKIMIGPRSALFTPFNNLGLIVIDEEHEGSYKSETSPKYHARETAIELAKLSNASVVLGSATPSVTAYYNALIGKYTLFKLNERAVNALMPAVHVVDLREELKNGNKSVFSNKLRELMEDRLAKGEQIMLFLNRRGYAGFVSCRACGEAMKCPHCDITLTYHNVGKLVCHYCGYETPMPNTCPKCNSKYIATFGTGTQKIEDMVKKMFPNEKVVRMDADTTKKKDDHEKILSLYANGGASILVGTQMIVKGHDFPNVTLVGILAADLSLYSQDYVATERTFDLLTQAAGRAGRGKKKGEVVIQTYSPDSYAVIAAANNDYDRFYNEEIQYRQLLQYPPIANMLVILIISEDEALSKSGANSIKKRVDAIINDDDKVIGPTKASLYKANDNYRNMIYIKSKDYNRLINIKNFVELYINENANYFRKICVQFDFNPMN